MAKSVLLYLGVFTHFKREEDSSMESAKLDEELRRMSAISSIRFSLYSMALFNESFASSNDGRDRRSRGRSCVPLWRGR